MIATTDAPPDWVTTELCCPLCGYNLRGLTEPRCPECGFAFAWAELLDAKRDRHPWLFEHGRGRSVRTFAATYARTSFPRRFWRTVTPANAVHVGRLLLYWLIASAALLTLGTLPFVRVAVDVARADTVARGFYTPTNGRPGFYDGPPFGPSGLFAPYVSSRPMVPTATISQAQLDAAAPPVWSAAYPAQVWDAWQPNSRTFGRQTDGTTAAAVVVLAWPWLSLATLLVFQSSMRRAKTRVVHVLRATIYGCDFGLWVVLAATALNAPVRNSPYFYNSYSNTLASALRGPFNVEAVCAVVAVAICALAASYRLTVAYARYLRFDRPLLTVLASQAMVVLAVAVVLSRTVRLF